MSCELMQMRSYFLITGSWKFFLKTKINDLTWFSPQEDQEETQITLIIHCNIKNILKRHWKEYQEILVFIKVSFWPVSSISGRKKATHTPKLESAFENRPYGVPWWSGG